MKILVLCQGGNNRSGCLAWKLKDLGHDALAAGLTANSKATITMLCEWAETIILAAESAFASLISDEFHSKLRFCDVGPDRWGSNTAPELQELMAQWLSRNSFP